MRPLLLSRRLQGLLTLHPAYDTASAEAGTADSACLKIRLLQNNGTSRDLAHLSLLRARQSSSVGAAASTSTEAGVDLPVNRGGTASVRGECIDRDVDCKAANLEEILKEKGECGVIFLTRIKVNLQVDISCPSLSLKMLSCFCRWALSRI